MSADQLAALVGRLESDYALRNTLEASQDLDSFLAITKEAGFQVSKADLLRYQAQHVLELDDADLESVSGGIIPATPLIGVAAIQLTLIGGAIAGLAAAD